MHMHRILAAAALSLASVHAGAVSFDDGARAGRDGYGFDFGAGLASDWDRVWRVDPQERRDVADDDDGAVFRIPAPRTLNFHGADRDDSAFLRFVSAPSFAPRHAGGFAFTGAYRYTGFPGWPFAAVNPWRPWVAAWWPGFGWGRDPWRGRDFGDFFRHRHHHPHDPTTPVPEPSSIALMGAGLALLGAGWRRRQQRAR